MSATKLLLDPALSDEEFATHARQLDPDAIEEVSAQLAEAKHEDLSAEAFITAYSKLRALDGRERPPLVSDVSFLPDPGDAAGWHGDMRAVWEVIETQRAELLRLRNHIARIDEKLAARNSIEWGLARGFLRREVRDLVASLSKQERQALQDAFLRYKPESPDVSFASFELNAELIASIRDSAPAFLQRHSEDPLRYDLRIQHHFLNRIRRQFGLGPLSTKAIGLLIESPVGQYFLAGERVAFMELALELVLKDDPNRRLAKQTAETK